MIRLPFTLRVLLAAISAFCPLACQADLPVLTVLHTFGPGGPGDLTPSQDANAGGAKPDAPLVQGPDGTLYGTTASGGAHGTGVVFKIGADGTGFTLLHSFGALDALFTNDTNSDGGRPGGALVIGKDGALYGVTAVGGPKGSGTVFKLNPDGSGFAVLRSFDPKGEQFHNDGGASPLGLTLGADGTLFGVAELGGEGRGLIFRMLPSGKNFHIIHSFDDPAFADGVNINDGGAIPDAAVTFGPDGTLYGTTHVGGTAGYGIVYKMDSGGKNFLVLHTFRRKDGDSKANGAFPSGPLALGPDGFLYGCTRQGGPSDGGIAYKISADGVFSVLHPFSAPGSENADGVLPAGPLVFSSGFWYGITGGGGETGGGTLFKVNAQGTKFFTLHDFQASEGGYTLAGLTAGHDGSLYGVSTNGGTNKTGTLFRVTFPQSK